MGVEELEEEEKERRDHNIHLKGKREGKEEDNKRSIRGAEDTGERGGGREKRPESEEEGKLVPDQPSRESLVRFFVA